MKRFIANYLQRASKIIKAGDNKR